MLDVWCRRTKCLVVDALTLQNEAHSYAMQKHEWLVLWKAGEADKSRQPTRTFTSRDELQKPIGNGSNIVETPLL